MALRFGDADSEKLLKEHGDWLALGEGEEIEFAAKTMRDFLVFTDRRVIVTDTQGAFRKKTEYLSIPYRALGRWSVESKGGGWKDGADLKIWISAALGPAVSIELQKDAGARDVMSLLSKHAL